MTQFDAYELAVRQTYESGQLKRCAGQAELQRLRSAARATTIKDKRVNIRLSSAGLLGI